MSSGRLPKKWPGSAARPARVRFRAFENCGDCDLAAERKYHGFAPGLYTIDGIGAGGFQFGGMTHRGSILALPDGIHAYGPTTLAEVDEASLAPLLVALPPGSIELLLFGCGATFQPVPMALRQRLRSLGVGCEPMSTAAACQTYNILLGEKRPVGAVLIAAP